MVGIKRLLTSRVKAENSHVKPIKQRLRKQIMMVAKDTIPISRVEIFMGFIICP